jgi:chromosome segregation protein
MLAREREWRELPAQIRAAWKRSREIESRIGAAQADEQEVGERADALEAQLELIKESLRAVQDQQQELTRELVLEEQQLAWQQGQVAQQEGAVAKLGTTEELLRSELTELATKKESTESELVALQARLEALQGEALYQRLSEAQTAAAVAQGAWEHRRDALDGLRGREAQLEAQIAAKRRRIEALSQEQESLARQIRDRGAREVVIQGWLSTLKEKIGPAEAEVADLESARERQVKEEGVLRTRLRGAENRHAQAVLAHSRQEDRLQRVRREIMDDFGLVEMEPTEGFPEQPPLPLGEMVSALPVVERLPDGLEEEIHQIKAQLRRMGSVNPNAPDEYAEVLDRYTFLTTQATDLEEAASSLREVIAELDEVMRREFQATFKEIAAGFEANFTELFGGGTAYLELSDPEDISQTGVEIMARPPGKRQQTLALLSGGERALTAVALIFAILSVSPPPFCILDEVDATLDEANVRRFRRALATLAEKTQFIVITHNRGTIQAANTIYGVSMGDDSVSQVVSLQFEGEQIAAPDGSVVEAKAG